MNSSDRIEALCLVKAQLEQWCATMPNWYYELHGCKDANIALQRVKQLIVYEVQQTQIQCMEELTTLSQSLGLYNEL